MALIELDGIEKTFVVKVKRGRIRRERRVVRAVDGVSFEIDAGSLVGYVGPNGAGKSTTVKMLTGILVPTAGRIAVAGLDPSRQRIRLARRIGVVFGQRVQLWWDLPLRDSFELLRHIYRVPAERHRGSLATFTELLELAPFLDTPVRQLSLGQRVRGELTAAMLHEPEILFLDEPTAGVDVELRRDMWEVVRKLRASGVTIILTTHYIAEAEEMADRIGVISKGEIILVEEKAELMRKLGRKQLTLHLQHPLDRIPPQLAGRQVELSADGNDLVYTFDAQAETTGITSLLRQLNELGIDFKDLRTEESSLEEIFVSLVSSRR